MPSVMFDLQLPTGTVIEVETDTYPSRGDEFVIGDLRYIVDRGVFKLTDPKQSSLAFGGRVRSNLDDIPLFILRLRSSND